MKQEGAVTLEACVSVLSFLILMLLLSSLFVMFMAQTTTAHALLQTVQSLSMDVYTIESFGMGDGMIGSVGDVVGGIVVNLFGSASNNPYYVSGKPWHKGADSEVGEAVKMRFIGYLTGGDEKRADELLTQMNVVKGLKGLDFSDSYVINDTLYAVVKYELEYDFNIWNVKPEPVEQKACAKLWKNS